MQKKVCVFCHNGLGDGLIASILSHNLHKNGWDVTTYHNGMQLLQTWFPHIPFVKYPQEEPSFFLHSYDLLLVFHNDTSPFILNLIEQGKKEAPEKIKVLYPYPTKRISQNPYYEDASFDVTKPIMENLYLFCRDILQLSQVTKHNGIIPPPDLIYRKEKKRVLLHVASSRKGKNWPIEKFLKLARLLKKEGYEPEVIAGSKQDSEPYRWIEKKGVPLVFFDSLEDVAAYIYESAYLVGNDSGLGHLASSLGIPTVTISRRKKVGTFWRPILSEGKLVYPSSFIPNISLFRLRDRYWQKFISTKKVFNAFKKLMKSQALSAHT